MKNLIPIIDVGHGGMVNGKYTTIGKKYYEFNSGLIAYEGVINRAIGRKLADKLKANGIHYRYTNLYNEDDMPLQERIAWANTIYKHIPNTYLLSIHSNAASAGLKGKGTKATGFEIWTSKGETQSDKLAEIAADLYISKFPKIRFRSATHDKDSKEADYKVLVKTLCPAFLVENLFFDNEREANYLMSDIGHEDISDCLFEVVKEIYNTEFV